MPHVTFYKANDNLVELENLKNHATGAYINDATVTMTLKDQSGSAVTGATGLSMAYVTGSNGTYRATIPYTISCTSHRSYTVEVTADAGSGLLGFWEVPVLIETRSQT